jgi:2-methylcitrate dehydratase PrpD
MSTSVTQAVVDFVTNASIDSFPEDVIEQGKRCVVDGIGVTLAGSVSSAGEIVRQQIKTMSSQGNATVLGPEHLSVPAALAARANGLAGHALDFDDTQLSRYPDRIFGLLTHPTIPPLTAALAVGEALDASGKKFLEAFLTGFEVECKIAEAIKPTHYRQGFHSSGTIGTFGAVIAAAKLMQLDPDRLARAIGIAASMSSGIRVNFGTMTKPLHVGRAAENGVTAAELASLGFISDPTALDGPWGYFSVFAGGVDEDKIIGQLGAPWAIVDPGFSVKPYPCGSLSHPSMDAMLKMVLENDIKPEQIKAVRLRAGSNILNPLRYSNPTNELEAKFSLQFVLSAIALRRKAGIHEFTDEYVQSAPVREMMAKVQTVLDKEIEAKGTDKMRSVVEIHLTDGRELVEPAEVYRGGPERPLTRDELHGKFTDCALEVLPPDAVADAIELIESVAELESVRELTAGLSSAATAAH